MRFERTNPASVALKGCTAAISLIVVATDDAGPITLMASPFGMIPSGQSPLPRTYNQKQPAATLARFGDAMENDVPHQGRVAFYKSEFKKHYARERQDGSDRFYYEVLMNKKRRFMLFSGVTVLSVMLAATRGALRQFLHVGILAALMPLPILSANRAMPKMADAYEMARDGNHKKADKTFSDALDEFNYSVFQRLFKPISYAVVLTALLTMPQNLSKPRTQWKALAEHYTKSLVNRISHQERFPTKHPHPYQDSRTLVESILCWPLEKADRLFAPNKGQWSTWLGDKLENKGWKRAYQPYPILKRLNNALQRQGDDVETWLRENPRINKILGPRPEQIPANAPNARR